MSIVMTTIETSATVLVAVVRGDMTVTVATSAAEASTKIVISYISSRGYCCSSGQNSNSDSVRHINSQYMNKYSISS